MKKLTLKKLNVESSEVLTREQLKAVMGGGGSGSGTTGSGSSCGGTCKVDGNCATGCVCSQGTCV
ncbi:hypothetical protein [Solitalea lacus]|uniref:hypothetical protein n=1 Tax=Solitalea lacus TaxID=2911172 RepID=UPI001EDAFE23|nr:hypothetical protein [Solitalea lacus]UKJ07506.1 hypothetical protein L2B55_18555 [Solitalea lacus]